MKNTRLWEAVRALATMESDVKSRVVVACEILECIRERELSPEHYVRLKRLLDSAGEKGPEMLSTGIVRNGRYKNTSRGRRNSTYSKYAEEIFSLHSEINGC